MQNRTLLKEVIYVLLLPVGSFQVSAEHDAQSERAIHAIENLFENEYTDAVLLVICVGYMRLNNQFLYYK